MSIATRRGDAGETDLLFGVRVSKTHPRVVAGGAVDELNAALGIVRCHAPELSEKLGVVQEVLVGLMGEVATPDGQFSRYQEQGFRCLNEEDLAVLDRWIAEIEAELPPPKGWAYPGATGSLATAHLDVARTVCRRAERHVFQVGAELREAVVVYLNRLSDVLWLMARDLEK
jgi:cob(I)alamin adenosyltransferase